MFELGKDDFVKTPEAIKVKVVFSPQKMHGEKKAHQSKVMIAVKVADEYVIDFVVTDIISSQLHLASLTTIDQEVVILNVQVLSGWESTVGW